MTVDKNTAQRQLTEQNLAMLLIQVERDQKPGRIVIVSDDAMPVQKGLIHTLTENSIRGSTVLGIKHVEDFLTHNSTDVIILPSSLQAKSVQQLRKKVQTIDQTVSFLSYSPYPIDDKPSEHMGFMDMPHFFFEAENPELMLNDIFAASKKTYQNRLKYASKWFQDRMQQFVKGLRLHEPIFSNVIVPQLPLPTHHLDAANIAILYERYSRIESTFTDDSNEGIRRLRFFRQQITDPRNGTTIYCGLKKMIGHEFEDAIALQAYLREKHPDISARHPVWLLHAEHADAHYVVFALFDSIDLGDSLKMLANSQSPRRHAAIDAILCENTATVSRLQRPLRAKNPKHMPGAIKDYYTKKTDAFLSTMHEHFPHGVACEQKKEKQEVLAALDNYHWLTPLRLSHKTRPLYDLCFSVLTDNSPKNSGLEFAKKPATARQLFAYLRTNNAQTADISKQTTDIQAKIAAAYRIYEATSHPGHRLEDIAHILGCEGVTLTPKTYARYRNHFIGNVMKQLQLGSIPDDWQAALLSSGPGIGWYKCLRKPHLISTLYLEKARLRFSHGETNVDEFCAKVAEYDNRRQKWCDNALVFAQYWLTMKNGTAQKLEQEYNLSATSTLEQMPPAFSPSQNAYVIAAQQLQRVDVERIVSFTHKYVTAQPNFIPFPHVNNP